MLDKTRQGAGEGSRLAREIFRFFKESGYLKVKLGVIEGSEKAAAFWKRTALPLRESACGRKDTR